MNVEDSGEDNKVGLVASAMEDNVDELAFRFSQFSVPMGSGGCRAPYNILPKPIQKENAMLVMKPVKAPVELVDGKHIPAVNNIKRGPPTTLNTVNDACNSPAI